MPEPPRKGETQSAFVSRCVKELTDNDEYRDQKQRVAVCYSLWRQSKKKGEKEMNSMHNHKISDKDDFPITGFGNNATIAGNYPEVPELPEDYEKPKNTLEIMEEELKIP